MLQINAKRIGLRDFVEKYHMQAEELFPGIVWCYSICGDVRVELDGTVRVSTEGAGESASEKALDALYAMIASGDVVRDPKTSAALREGAKAKRKAMAKAMTKEEKCRKIYGEREYSSFLGQIAEYGKADAEGRRGICRANQCGCCWKRSSCAKSLRPQPPRILSDGTFRPAHFRCGEGD